MKTPQTTFDLLPLDASNTVSWIHIGDTHLTTAGEQNALDLGRIVDEINAVYAGGGVDFVFVPGDIADDGSGAAYEVFRRHMDRLRLPWCAIVGDHDVHERSFDNFRRYVCAELHGTFSVGSYRFLRLNALSEPRPDSFVLDEEQLRWAESELSACARGGLKAVLFLHCYPSELKQGGEELKRLLERYPVLLVEMGHTHYNEISNDGTVLYSATRSTGQIEEGPVGYSLTTLDEDCVSWEFLPLGQTSLVSITHPGDVRLQTTRSGGGPSATPLSFRAKIWPAAQVARAYARVGDELTELERRGGVLWTGAVSAEGCEAQGGSTQDGNARGGSAQELEVFAEDERKRREQESRWSGSIRICGGGPKRTIQPVDKENAIGAWKERGLLGTQLGPNKNGRKW